MMAVLTATALASMAAGGAPVVVPAPRSLVPGEGVYSVPEGSDMVRVVSFSRDAAIPREGYRLRVSSNGVSVISSDDAGAFYAMKTLEQMAKSNGGRTVLRALEVDDSPRYGWRGVHIDDSRHFFGKQTLKRVLDLMAMHKLNVLHWHLTDDQGWRLDVPGRPELVKYGAIRPASPVHGALWKPGQSGGRKTLELDGQAYGPFFYTEADVREIVAYAAERHISIVPEIELPGHVAAALAAYPHLACRSENVSHRHPRLVWGMEKEVLCLGNDDAIKLMEDVFDYVCRVFPFRFVHIGGDECPTDRWKTCPKCQARIKELGLGDESGLQPWATRHFIAFLEKRGKRTVGWDEYLNGNVPTNAVGMNWRTMTSSGVGHDGVKLMTGAEAAEKGHDIVVCPHSYTYFYYDQGLKDDPFQYGATGRSFGGIGRLPLRKVYDFDPCAGIDSAVRGRILGGQCCNWSEYTWNEYDLEWKMWPRACAMAEVLWLGEAKPGFEDFLRRMEVHRRKLVEIGVNCAPLGY